jgi:hypothetical protein
MSTIIASNVSDGTLSIPTTFVTNGSAKAWVNFDGTGTIASLDSFNVSSLVDSGTGRYTVGYSSVFASANYVITYGFQRPSATGSLDYLNSAVGASGSLLRCIDSSGVDEDVGNLGALYHGDLA